MGSHIHYAHKEVSHLTVKDLRQLQPSQYILYTNKIEQYPSICCYHIFR